MSDNASFVFLVMDDRFGVVSASLILDEAVADMNARVLEQHDSDTLTNPGSFRIKRIELGSQKAKKAKDQRDAA